MKMAGRTIPLSLPRRWVGDLAAFSHSVPIVGGEMVLNVKTCAQARRSAVKAPSWSACLTKAFGMASARIPELRRSHLTFPIARLYEHPESVAAIAVNREFEGEAAVFLGLMQGPERLSLAGVDFKLREFREKPFEELGCYRRLIRTSRFPLPVRRLLWWYGLCISGKQKSKLFGTFAVNSLGNSRIRLTHFMSPITTMLYYGASGVPGELVIQMAFDHRVFDATTAMRGVGELERILNCEVAEEASGG